MNKKILFFLVFLSNVFYSYSQQQFNYNFYVDETVRKGVLFYNTKENTAIYLDKITSTKTVTNNKDDDNADNEVIGMSFNENLDSYFFKNTNEVLFTYNLLKNNYLVEDHLPKMEWELSSEKREIQHLTCYKATAGFRGRNWTAWYSPDIPVNYGPWKFYGLPGLIVEITEDTNRFTFVLTEYVLNSKNTVPTIDSNNFKKISMKKMAEITDETFNNMMNILSDSRSDEVESTSTILYNEPGIEAHYEWEEEK